MKNKFKKTFALLLGLVICISLSGCKFVVREQQVLMNPQDQSTSSEEENSTSDGEVASNEDSSTTENSDTTQSSGATNNSVATTNVEPKLSGTLEIQIFTNENEDIGNAWTTIIDSFEETTGVRVTAYIGSQVNTQFTKRWMGNNPPDLALLSGAGIPDIALEESGGLYDCTDLLKNGYVYGTNEKIWDVTDPRMHQQSSKNAPYYRPGINASAQGIFWDQAYLEQLGLTAPKNYTQLQAFVKSAQKKGVAVFTTNGATGNYARESVIMPAIAAYGGDVYKGAILGLSSAWNSKEVRDVFQRWYDFCRNDGAILTGTSSLDHTTSQMKWLNHDALLIGNGIWLPWETENNTPSSFQMEYGTSPLILESQKTTVEVTPVSMIVAAKAKNLENAKAFVRFLYTKENQEIMAEAQGYLCARTDMNYDNMAMDAVSKKFLKYITGGDIQLQYRQYIWGSLNEDINAAVHGLMTGKMTVDEAINTITSKAK